jgi:hypothetical protein
MSHHYDPRKDKKSGKKGHPEIEPIDLDKVKTSKCFMFIMCIILYYILVLSLIRNKKNNCSL